MRRPSRLRRPRRGFALMGFLALLVAGVLAYLVSTLGPEAIEAYRKHKTEAALAEAREALLGYATRFRDVVSPNDVYGFLPLPDLGRDRNNNAGCQDEGCDAANFAGGGREFTVIGRFPWRLMGMEPIRDGYGECLWYVVSGSHKRTQPLAPMNWDTLGELNVMVANAGGAANLTSMIASAHDRPVAIIFSPGPAMAGQDRSALVVADVPQCGGNYDVANYLAPETAGALAGVTNYFGGSTNNASGYTRDETDDVPPGPNNNKPLYTQGRIFLRSADNTLWPGACPAGTNCPLAADDRGLALTTGELFGALRKNANFRVDLSSLFDRMWGCVRDFIAAGGSESPQGIPDYVEPGDKIAGRFPNNACYANFPPVGYFANWQDMYYVARPRTGFPDFLVNVDGVDQSCRAVLIFAGQRGPGQSRVTLAERSNLANYLEGNNLASFTGLGRTFSGQSTFGPISATQLAQQDIVRCVPTINTESFVTVGSPELTAEGFPQIVGYDPNTRTLTLGREGVTTDDDAPAGALFGCAWTPEANPQGKGFRAYFTFRFNAVGSSVGNNGFVFAAVDADTNPLMICGAAGSHLGYSGDNGVTPPLKPAKIGIEFDQGRNSGFSESTDLAASNPGRNDPCGTSCGKEYSSHAAIVFWGHEYQNPVDGVTRPQDDDNVHGYPTTGSQSAYPRMAPQSPGDVGAAIPGIAYVNMRGQASQGDNSYLYHVRVEVSRIGSYAEPSPLIAVARAAATSHTDLGSPGSTIGGVSVVAGDRILLTAQTDSADNGIYVWQGLAVPLLRATDADTASELSYAALRVTEGSGTGYWQQIAQVLNVGSDPQHWQYHASQPIATGSNFLIQTWIEPNPPARTPLITAMENTTRAMEQLYPMRREAACVGGTCPSGQSCSVDDNYCYRPNIPTLSSTAKVYDVAGLACGAGGTCAPGYACGTDNVCYRQGLRSVRLGFTGSQRTQDQQVLIRNFFASWLQ